MHISDLHFGTQAARENYAYLVTEVHRVQPNRVVITGDLFDKPDASDFTEFQSFRTLIDNITKGDTVVIPGNHDRSVKGNQVLGFGEKLEQLAQLTWNPLIVDPDLKLLFRASILDGKLGSRREVESVRSK